MNYQDQLFKKFAKPVGGMEQLPVYIDSVFSSNLLGQADEKIEKMQKVLVEAMRLMKNGAGGVITDTVWSDTVPNTTLYELMHNLTSKE